MPQTRPGAGAVHDPRLIEDAFAALRDDVALVPPHLADWWAHYLHTCRDRYLDVLSFMGPDDRDKVILEVGSCPGHLTVLLKRLGYRVQGVDLDPQRLAALWDKYDLQVCAADIETSALPCPDCSCDVVLFTEVLEHLRINPLRALREIRRVLKPDGRLILTTPRVHPLARVRFLLGTNYQESPLHAFSKLERLGHMGHVRLYLLAEIRELLEATGFAVVATRYVGGSRTPVATKLSHLLRLHLGRFTRCALRRTTYVVARPIPISDRGVTPMAPPVEVVP